MVRVASSKVQASGETFAPRNPQAQGARGFLARFARPRQPLNETDAGPDHDFQSEFDAISSDEDARPQKPVRRRVQPQAPSKIAGLPVLATLSRDAVDEQLPLAGQGALRPLRDLAPVLRSLQAPRPPSRLAMTVVVGVEAGGASAKVAWCLARALVDAGKETLLIDGDPQTAELTYLTGHEDVPGLFDEAGRNEAIEECVSWHDDGVPHILSATAHAGGRGDDLSWRDIDARLKLLAGQVTRLVVDAGCIHDNPAAAMLAARASDVIIAIDSDLSIVDDIEEAATQLRDARAPQPAVVAIAG